MIRIVTLCVVMLLMAAPAMAVPVPYSWDPAVPDADHPTPVAGYYFYLCTDQALTTCTRTDVGMATAYAPDLGTGTYYPYVKAYGYLVTADNPDGTTYQSGTLVESERSNIVPTRVNVPPGNPRNVKVRTQ